jgi:hypothetical protein
MKPLLLAAILIPIATAHAATEFTLVHGGEQVDRGVFVSPTRDGGYVAVGASRSFGDGMDDVYLVRTDAAGELLWSRTYGGADQDNGWSVHETADGFVMAGFTRSFGAGDFDFYLIRTDAAGEQVWSRTYGGPGKDRCWALLPTRDGGFLLAGETTSSGAGQEDFYLVRTDSLGNEQWSRTYGGAAGDRCFAVAPADDGGYVLAGQTYSEGGGDRDAYVLKTDADGEREWSRTFGGPASDVGHAVTRTSDGAFVVTGYTTSFATSGDDPYLIKLDTGGETQWTRVLDVPGIAHTLTGDQASDGGFYLVGFSEYPDTGTRAALLVRTDPDGRLRWHRDLLSPVQGQSLGYTVRATADGGCVFTGHTTENSAGHLDLLLVGVPAEDPH